MTSINFVTNIFDLNKHWDARMNTMKTNRRIEKDHSLDVLSCLPPPLYEMTKAIGRLKRPLAHIPRRQISARVIKMFSMPGLLFQHKSKFFGFPWISFENLIEHPLQLCLSIDHNPSQQFSHKSYCREPILATRPREVGLLKSAQTLRPQRKIRWKLRARYSVRK